MMIKKSVNLIDENTYILFGKESAIVIDPGIGFCPSEEMMNGLLVSKIILTHGHFDHIYSTAELVKKYGATVYIHEADADFLTNNALCDPIGTGLQIELPKADVLLKDGDVITFEENNIKVIHTPGHTPGSVCLLVEDVMFSGDTVFKGTIGRTDFPQSSPLQMKESLKKLKETDDSVIIYPGHGEPTNFKAEKENFRYYM